MAFLVSARHAFGRHDLLFKRRGYLSPLLKVVAGQPCCQSIKMPAGGFSTL